MWDMVDAELAFQEEVENEHGVVYGDGSEASLQVLLAAHGEVGYVLRPDDAQTPVESETAPGQAQEGATDREIESAVGVEVTGKRAEGSAGIMFGDIEVAVATPVSPTVASETICFGDIAVPVEHGVVAAVDATSQQCGAGREASSDAQEGCNRIGKREWRRKQAVVSAPIVSKVVAEMRAEIGVCCSQCGHADIESVRRDCQANYQAAQWTCLRIMKDRGLHAEHVQLYLLPCLVAYFHRIQFADGLGGYTGSLGVARRRIWRRRHRQVA